MILAYHNVINCSNSDACARRNVLKYIRISCRQHSIFLSSSVSYEIACSPYSFHRRSKREKEMKIDVILIAFSGLLVLMHSPTYSTFGRSLMIVIIVPCSGRKLSVKLWAKKKYILWWTWFWRFSELLYSHEIHSAFREFEIIYINSTSLHLSLYLYRLHHSCISIYIILQVCHTLLSRITKKLKWNSNSEDSISIVLPQINKFAQETPYKYVIR